MIVHKILRADETELPNIKSCIYSERVNAEENVRPGCVASASIEVEVYGAQGVAVTGGEALTYYQVNGDAETLIGTFYAEPNIDSRMSFRFKAYDPVSKLDADFSARLDAIQGNFPMTLADIVDEAATVAGVSFDSLTFPMASTEVSAFYADGITCRQIIGWAAEIACRFVKCKNDGNLTFAWYAAKDGYRINPSAGTQGNVQLIAYKESGLSYENYTVSVVDGVTVYPTDEEDEVATYPSSPLGPNIISVRNNLLLTDADPTTLSAVAQNVYTVMSALPAYAPFSASLFPSENPFHAGDIVSVTDVQGNSFQSLVMSLTMYPYRALLGSTGKETYEEQTNSNTKKGLLNLASNILRLKSLFVESLEAIVARIDNLFAQEITVTGVLHSEDYSKSDNQTYAFDGMGIDFSKKEINATNFALSDDGAISARAGKIGGFQFIDAGAGGNVALNVSPTQFLDEDGNESTFNVGFAYITIVTKRTLYPWQPANNWSFYRGGDNGHFVYQIDNIRNSQVLDYVAITLSPYNFTDERPNKALLKWYYNLRDGDWSQIGETTLEYCDPTVLMKPTLVYMENGMPSGMQQFVKYKLEIYVLQTDICSVDCIYGGYGAMYGGETTIATDGITTPSITVNGKDVESLLVPAPASADEGRILKVVNGVPTWVAP